LLDAAALAATSQQELRRIQGQTAASLQATFDAIAAATGASKAATDRILGAEDDDADSSAWWSQYAPPATSSTPSSTSSASSADIETVRSEVRAMAEDLRSGMAQIAANTGKAARTLDNITRENGGDALSVVAAAA